MTLLGLFYAVATKSSITLVCFFVLSYNRSFDCLQNVTLVNHIDNYNKIKTANWKRLPDRKRLPDTRQAVFGGLLINSGQNIAFAAGVICGPKFELGSKVPTPRTVARTSISSPLLCPRFIKFYANCYKNFCKYLFLTAVSIHCNSFCFDLFYEAEIRFLNIVWYHTIILGNTLTQLLYLL